MKLSRRLIPAFAMLLVSAVLMSTASYAWFSMRGEVTATGMQVNAVSNSIYLEIKGANDQDYGATGNANVNEALFPVAHIDWDNVADIEEFNNNWYYKFSDNAGSSAATQNATTHYINAFDGYVATTTYQVRLHTGSADKAYDLYVSNVTIPENSGITVVIAGAQGFVELKQSADIQFDVNNVLSDEVTSEAQAIKVYIYIDGNHEKVYSDNIAALTGAVSFELSVSAEDHQNN